MTSDSDLKTSSGQKKSANKVPGSYAYRIGSYWKCLASKGYMGLDLVNTETIGDPMIKLNLPTKFDRTFYIKWLVAKQFFKERMTLTIDTGIS